MRKLFYLTLVVVVAAFGFYLGRMSGIKDIVMELPPTNEFHPLPPPPPESEPYIPGAGDPDRGSKILLIESPVDGAEIYGAFEVSGRIGLDSERLLVSLMDDADEELFSRKIELEEDGEESHVRFNVPIGDLGYVGEATLRIVYFGAGGGVETRQVTLLSDDLVDVEIFFTNPFLNPWETCNKVFPVRRQVSSNSNIYRSVLEELFEGPTDHESDNGYGSELPGGVKLKSVGSDANGILTADFDRKLERGVAGSCRVTAIQAQIDTTLKQFPEVREVVISVEGEKEGILQP